MKNKVYNSYKVIHNFLHRMNLLQGVVRINTDISPYYIPICYVRTNKLDNNHMLLNFDTLDTNTGNINKLDYESFLNYMLTARHGNFGEYKHHKVGPIGQLNTVVDYVSGEFKLPNKMICHSFKLNKKHFYLVKILSPNEHSILLLCSPDVKTNWITELGLNCYKLSKSNLANILVLLKEHLFNQPKGIELINHDLKYKELVNLENIKLVDNNIVFQDDYGSLKFTLKNIRAYIDVPTNADPRLTFEYKNNSHNNLKVNIILASKYRMNLISKLTN